VTRSRSSELHDAFQREYRLSAERPLLFESPRRQKIGDAALGLILLPFSIAALSFLLFIPASLVLTVWGWNDSAWNVTFAVVVGFAVVLAMLAVVWRLGWTLELHEDHLRLGPLGIGPRIPYAKVQFLKLGEQETARLEERRATVPLLVHRSPHRRYRIFLDHADAERCFEALRRRCENAGALHLVHKGLPEHVPEDPNAALSARKRFRRYWAATGILSLASGAMPFIVLVLYSFDHSTTEAAIRTDRALYWAGLAPGIIAFGWFALHRAWRHHRAIREHRDSLFSRDR